ncbi:ATP-binding protein, partial [candidate division KSB1 bacterium]
MIDYHPRWMANLLKTVCKEASIVVLTGPRQVGKSTLLLHEMADTYRLFNLDDLDILGQMQRDAQAVLLSDDRIIIDEAQRAPQILLTVKKLVDEFPQKRFILSGSANLLLMAQVSDSLAGRAQFLHLMPMTRAELRRKIPPDWLVRLLETGTFHPPAIEQGEAPELHNCVWTGGLPIVLQRSDPESLTRWREGYIESYLERDLRQLSMIDSLTDFRRLMKLAALRNGQELNQSELARDAALSQPTAHRYLNLLEISEWIQSVPTFIGNRSLRIMKRPKLTWFDTGIAAHLQGFRPTSLASEREWGRLFETYILNQIIPLCGLLTPKAEL